MSLSIVYIIPQIGDLLEDRYIIEELLGIGGMTAVYLARDLKESHAKLVIKLINEAFQAHPKAKPVLHHEAHILTQLHHGYIIKLIRQGWYCEYPFLVLEYSPGISLKRALKQPEIYLAEPALRTAITLQLKSVLAYIHEKGIVHGDLKPENVFLLGNGKIQLIDFGLARYYRNVESHFDPMELQSYTPAYASESVKCGKPAMPEDDLYALNKILAMLGMT